MYCRLCDIEYPNSLRFCKWCGGGLVAREAVAKQHCPSCGAETEREWVFCNECGVDLATLGAQPRDMVCPACSATVRKGWMFCRQCGEQVATDRAAERCGQCGAGIRSTWTFCKQCATRLKHEAGDVRHGFRTVAGIPALPPEDLEDAPFSNLRSGELPPLEDVIKSDNRRAQAAPPSSAEASAGGTHPFTTSRSTGQLEADALEKEIRTGRPAEAVPASPPAPQPASFGRLEASELIQPVASPPPRPVVAPVPVAPEPPPPVLESTQAFASPFAPSKAEPVAAPPPVMVPPPPPPPVIPQPTEAQPRVETVPPTAYPTIPQSPVAPPPAAWAPPPPAAPPNEANPSYGQPAQAPSYEPVPTPSYEPVPTPSYDRSPTLSLPPEVPSFDPPSAVEGARSGSSSAVKWVALALAMLAIFAVVGVGGVFAVRAWRTRQTVVETPPTPAPQPAPTPAPEPKPAVPTAPEGMTLVAAATFSLGSNDPKDEYSSPAHDVTVKAFYIDLNEVTNAQYKAFVDATSHTPPKEGWVNGAPKPGTESWPVVYVSWDDALGYAKWAGKRLPSESEWELAARGTDGRKYPWGNDWDPTRGNLGKDGKTGTPDPVGTHPTGQSPCGAFDMLGNVWEWTGSSFSVYPGGKAAPPESADRYRIIRGGAFDNSGSTTATYRGFFKSDSAWPKVGFRCAKDAS